MYTRIFKQQPQQHYHYIHLLRCGRMALRIPMLLLLMSLLLVVNCSAQLTFHTDANTNSFTLKAPGVQQSFTRYFKGRGGNLLAASQQLQYSPGSTSAIPASSIPLPQYAQAPQQQIPQAEPQPQQTQHAFPTQPSSLTAQVPFPTQSLYQQQFQQPRYPQYVQQPAASLPQLSLPQHYQQALLQQQQPQPAAQPEQYAASPQAAQQGITQDPTYAEQMMAAYYNYQQQQLEQQRIQDQLQRQLLHQLYRHPQMGQTTSALASNIPQTQYQSHYQPHSHHHHQTGSGTDRFYSTQQYADYLQNQAQNVQSEQFNNMEQSYMGRAHTNLNSAPMSAAYNSSMSASIGALSNHYSPADKVSNVKYSSRNGLSYNY